MKRVLAAVICVLLFSSVFAGCKTEENPERHALNVAYQEATDAMLQSAKVSYETKLSYSLEADGAVEMSSSYEAKTERLYDDEAITRKTLYYGLPMDERHYYIDGVYYSISFEESALQAEMTPDEYKEMRGDLLFTFFLNPTHFKKATVSERDGVEVLMLDGYDDAFADFVRERLEIGKDVPFTSLKVTGVFQKNDSMLSSATVSVEGGYKMCGMDKTFTVTYEVSNVMTEASAVRLPDGYTYTPIGGIQYAKLLNNAYNRLQAVGNFGLEKNAEFSLTYADVETRYNERDTYAQSTGKNTFRFSLTTDTDATINGTPSAGTHLFSYHGATLYEVQDGMLLSKSNDTGVLDMYYNAAEYYNASAVAYETLRDVTVSEDGGRTIYKYQYAEDEVDYMITSYINHLYNNMDGFIKGATAVKYSEATGETVIDTEQGTVYAQSIHIDVTYTVQGHDLHCTIEFALHYQESPEIIEYRETA